MISVTTNCVLRINLENYGIATRGIHNIWQGKMEDLGKFGIFARFFDSAWRILQKM